MKCRFNFSLSLLVLVLAIMAVGGAAFAWFTDKEVEGTAFTAGTVRIGEPQLVSGQSLLCCPPGPIKKLLCWKIKNIGSKKARLRVKLHVECCGGYEETAWGVGKKFGGGNAQYFTYEKGSGSQQNPKWVNLGAGSSYFQVGKVYVWDDGSKLYVKYKTDSGWRLGSTHLYAGLATPVNHAPGQLGWQASPPANENDYTYQLDSVYSYQGSPAKTIFSNLSNGSKIYLAAHAEVGRSAGNISYTLVDGSNSWVKGGDGYFYYNGVIPSGNRVEICFEFQLPEDYKSGSCRAWLEAEAVQASHNAMDHLWPQHPF